MQCYTKNELTSDLTDYIYKNLKDKENIIIAGDIHIDLLGMTNELYDYLISLTSAGFYSIIDKYRRIDNESRSYIDHAFVKTKKELVYRVGVFHLNITNHNLCAIKFEITNYM